MFCWVKLWWLWRPKHMIYIICILIKAFTETMCPLNKSIFMLEEKTLHIRIGMFHHRIKVVSQENIVFICSDPFLCRDKWISTKPAEPQLFSFVMRLYVSYMILNNVYMILFHVVSWCNTRFLIVRFVCIWQKLPCWLTN